MRNFLSVAVFLLVCLLLFASSAIAQPGGRKPPRVGSSNVPVRPSATRGVANEPEEVTKPFKPGARFSGNDTSAATAEEETAASDERPSTNSPRGGSRYTNETAAEEISRETEEPAAPRESIRSASLDNQTKSRGAPSSRRLLEQTQEEDQAAEPAPLTNRGTDRGIEAQNIQVSLNETPAGEVLSLALNYQHESAITGYPIRLEQVLAASPDGGSRRAAVKAYWNLVVSIADYHHALAEFDSITQVAASSGDKLLEAAAAGAEARVAETKITVTAAQFDLAGLTAATGSLPIPADAPVIGEYRTEYTAIFGRGPAPVGIKRLSVMMPLYRDQVLARSRAVVSATVAQSKSDDLQTFKELSAHRRAFLTSILNYNDAIADYALQLATPGMSVETVTSMLIVRSQPAADSQPELSGSASRGNSEVMPVTATAPIERSVIKPRRIGSARTEPTEFEHMAPNEAESDQLDSETLTTNETTEEPDATEAPAQRRDFRFTPKRGEE